jgi:rubrerythrin
MRNGAKLEHLNRTGTALSPALTAELIAGTSGTHPTADGDAQAIAQVRIDYAHSAEPVGSVPPPASVKATLKTVTKAVTGKKMLVFVDKLGERLAFERSGTRLYDALLSKFDAHGSWEGGPARSDLEEIREEEREHFLMLRFCIEELGGDPTAVTPSANLHAVASKGLCAVLSDARTDLREGLEAILLAELVDNDCWENLSDLARALGYEDLSARFEVALAQEREHLRRVRLWLGVALSRNATGGLAEPFVERTAERDLRQSQSAELAVRPGGTARAKTTSRRPRSGAVKAGVRSRSGGAKGRSRPQKSGSAKRGGRRKSR